MEKTDTQTASSENQSPMQYDAHVYSDDGVDLTLIRWMLSISPTERLQVLQQNVQSLSRLINESTFS
jgi:hypothetical protein